MTIQSLQLNSPTLCFKGLVDILEHLDSVWAATFLLGVEEDVSFFGYCAVDHVEEHRTESLLHVRADPDQEPIVKLYGGGQNSTNTGARTDGNATAEEVGEVRETGELGTPSVSVRI